MPVAILRGRDKIRRPPGQDVDTRSMPRDGGVMTTHTTACHRHSSGSETCTQRDLIKVDESGVSVTSST